jgi:lipid-A-disaccharide synthase
LQTLFVVAGEVSGDLVAAPLVEVLLRRAAGLHVVGIGGSRMAAAGCRILQDSTTWGAVGYVDPILHLGAYLRRLRAVESAIRAAQPAVLVLVDFPAFNLRLAERLRGMIPVVYYFPPMVSVRKGDRAALVGALGMRLLAALRREEAAYRRAGADVVFIGHPIVDLVASAQSAADARARFEIPLAVPVVGLLPGSRTQEIREHLRVMLAAAARIRAQQPAVRFLVPVAAPPLRPAVERAVGASSVPVHIVDHSHDAMRASTVVVAATGTATLEAAVLDVPMVAVYRLPWPGMAIARRLVSVPYAALPNILAGRMIVPELLQERMTPAAISGAVLALLGDPARRDAMRRDLRAVAEGLGPAGALERAAGEVMQALARALPQRSSAG